ncbi:MAG: hypothetical protein KA146_02185 [Leptospiraceae bacterium]|nr:hypothetical protein [Leptospiraceae bacterium]
MKKKVKPKARTSIPKKQFDKLFLDWKIEANKELQNAYELTTKSLEEEWKIKNNLAEKTLRHMEVVERFLEIQTAIFERLETKLK